jgi:hypothetical protein
MVSSRVGQVVVTVLVELPRTFTLLPLAGESARLAAKSLGPVIAAALLSNATAASRGGVVAGKRVAHDYVESGVDAQVRAALHLKRRGSWHLLHSYHQFYFQFLMDFVFLL